MNDRKLRTIGMLSLITGIAIVLLIILMYALEIPGPVMIPVLILYTIIQFRFSSSLFKILYHSTLADLPKALRKRYPPEGFKNQNLHCDVLLIRPPSAVLSSPDCGEALGLGYLASVLRSENYAVTIVDARLEKLDVMEVVELVLAYDPKTVGINLNFQYLAPVTQVMVSALRKRDYDEVITLGGLYSSVAAEFLLETMPEVDVVVRFEGEETYLDLIKNIDNREMWNGIPGLVFSNEEGTIQTTPLRPLISDIDHIPHPGRDHLPLVSQQQGYAYVLSSRGCRGRCAYCVQSRSVTDPEGARWRGRDPVDVVDEIEEIVTQSGCNQISLVDDDIFGASKDGSTHAHKLAQEIIDRGLDIKILTSVQPRDVKFEVFALLKQAGLESVILAVDNFSQPVLDRYQKYSNVEDNINSINILNKLGIDAYLGIIMFDPYTTFEELKENMRVMKEIPAFLRSWQILSKLEIYHGSPLTEFFDGHDLLDWNGYFASYDFKDQRIGSAYAGIEAVIKEAYPAIAQLDGFRWGNFEYSEEDQMILEHFSTELKEINFEFNRQILEMAITVIDSQQGEEKPIPLHLLASDELLTFSRDLNRSIIIRIEKLREMATE